MSSSSGYHSDAGLVPLPPKAPDLPDIWRTPARVFSFSGQSCSCGLLVYNGGITVPFQLRQQEYKPQTCLVLVITTPKSGELVVLYDCVLYIPGHESTSAVHAMPLPRSVREFCAQANRGGFCFSPHGAPLLSM